MKKALMLDAKEAWNLEHALRQYRDGGGERAALWRKVADLTNQFDDEEYRRLYRAPLPRELRK